MLQSISLTNMRTIGCIWISRLVSRLLRALPRRGFTQLSSPVELVLCREAAPKLRSLKGNFYKAALILCVVSFSHTNRNRRALSKTGAFYLAPRLFLLDVLLEKLGTDRAAHRSRDERDLRGVGRGALPLRALLCYLWNRHRNGTWTGRASRYVASFCFWGINVF